MHYKSFMRRKSYHSQTFHDASLGPGEGSWGLLRRKNCGEGGQGGAPNNFRMLVMHYEASSVSKQLLAQQLI